jgi:hypothetical protein
MSAHLMKALSVLSRIPWYPELSQGAGFGDANDNSACRFAE